MSIENINLVAVCVSAIAGFGVGGIWFGPKTFYPMWVKAMDYKEGEAPLSKYPMATVFGSTFVMMIVQSFGLAMIMNLGEKT